MRQILLASHAELAKGILSAVELIAGTQQNLKVYSAYTGAADVILKTDAAGLKQDGPGG